MSVTYLEMADIIGEYYGTGSDVWQKFAAGELQGQELINAVNQVPGANVTLSKSGSVLGYDYINPFPQASNPISNVNSNVPNASYGGNSFSSRVNGSYTFDSATSSGSFSSGARRVSTGAKVATVAGKIANGVTAVSVGMQLGAKIDSALYNIGDFFGLNPPASLNPETWDSIATTEKGKDVIRALFGVDGEDTTMYLPEDAIDYMYRYWLEQGLWSGSSGGPTVSWDSELSSTLNYPNSYDMPMPLGRGFAYTYYGDEHMIVSPVPMVAYETGSGSDTIVHFEAASKTPFNVTRYTNGTQDSTISAVTTTYHNETFYIYATQWYKSYNVRDYVPATIRSPYNTWDIAKIICDGTISTPAPITGVEPNPNATQIDPAQVGNTPITQAYPNLFGNPIEETVPQADGTNKTYRYYPVPWPTTTTEGNPISGTSDQTNPFIDPDTATDTETKTLTDTITGTPTGDPTTPATPPDTGSGSSPTVITPTGSASSLWAVYNPTQAQVNAFGAWLWSSDLVEQIKKLFNDPMQAIIGIHKVFATPATGAAQNIKCGYIDSGISAAVVTNQYTDINCGTVNLREYFGNVFDYRPYTDVSLFLPFIGIVRLDVSDIMRSNVEVIYHVDVITGACLAEVKVHRDGEHSVLYTYAGSAIVSYPISSGSYASAVTGVLSIAGGIAGTILSGGAAAPAIMGGVMGATHLHSDVQKSGGFSGSAGAMGGKKPYLIISRPQTNMADGFNKFEGKPTYATVTLSDCTGFTKVKTCHIEGLSATEDELTMIMTALTGGVFI